MIRIIDKSFHGTLTGLLGTVDTLQWGLGCNNLILFNRSATAALYARVDGLDPSVRGDASFYVGPNSSRLFGVPNYAFPEMRIVSDELTPLYSVECNP